MKRRTRTEVEVEVEEHVENERKSQIIISKALLNLSFNDRNAIEEEIHGVSCMAIEETPEIIEESLANFESEIEKIEHKPGYLKAQNLVFANNSNSNSNSNSSSHPRSWLSRKEFKLRFLRSELFDAKKAALRFARCHDFLLETYGEFALRRPIRMTDLSREDMAFLREGQYQLFPYRDRSGRRIYGVVVNKRVDVSRRILLRVFFYLWFVLCGGADIAKNDLNNIETQRKGVVCMVFPSVQHMGYANNDNILWKIKFLTDRVSATAAVAEVIPLRITAIHICLPKSAVTQVGLTFAKTLKAWNARTKIHLGHPLELKYALQGYGIPTELIPSTDTGNVKNINLKQWMKLRKQLEPNEHKCMAESGILYSSDSDYATASTDAEYSVGTETDMMNIVECPLSTDVVFRRGKSMNYHPGNVMFQNLIESRIHEHTLDPNTTQSRRQIIEIELIQEVRINGGRFLKWNINKGWWVIMDSEETTGTKSQEADKEILSKVHYAFRDFRKKMGKIHQNEIVNASSTHAFEQQDGKKRSRFSNVNQASTCSPISSVSSTICSENECVEPLGCNSSQCGYFFSTDGGSRLNFSRE
eukprot:jgi/Psemu1/236728/estExt_Genewise1.C_540002